MMKMQKQSQNKVPPAVFYEKPENDPTSHVYYQVNRGWNNVPNESISQGVNDYIFNNPWNNAIKTQVPQAESISGYNVGEYA